MFSRLFAGRRQSGEPDCYHRGMAKTRVSRPGSRAEWCRRLSRFLRDFQALVRKHRLALRASEVVEVYDVQELGLDRIRGHLVDVCRDLAQDWDPEERKRLARNLGLGSQKPSRL